MSILDEPGEVGGLWWGGVRGRGWEVGLLQGPVGSWGLPRWLSSLPGLSSHLETLASGWRGWRVRARGGTLRGMFPVGKKALGCGVEGQRLLVISAL